MIEFYFLDIEANYMPLLTAIRENPLTALFNRENHPPKIRGQVNFLDYTYTNVYNYHNDPAPMPMRWGLTINAKGQRITTATLPISALYDLRAVIPDRCVVPAAWYYETLATASLEGLDDRVEKNGDYNGWKGVQHKDERLATRPDSNERCNFGALYKIEDGIPCFAILMMEDDTPLMIPHTMVDNWLLPESDPKPVLSHRLRKLRRGVLGIRYDMI